MNEKCWVLIVGAYSSQTVAAVFTSREEGERQLEAAGWHQSSGSDDWYPTTEESFSQGGYLSEHDVDRFHIQEAVSVTLEER